MGELSIHSNPVITLSGCMGSGINHVRLLLGLGSGKEIRDFSGRRVPDDKKLDFVMTILYHENRVFVNERPIRGGETNVWHNQSYWLRIEWLTRELYEDCKINHSRTPTMDGSWVYFQVGDAHRVLDLYKAKCPDLNGLGDDAFLKGIEAWRQVPAGVTSSVMTDQLYERGWVGGYLKKLLSDLDHGPVDMDMAEKIHHRWCDLNQLILKNRSG